MVLPQDQAQASQASNIIAEREYQAQLAQYKKEKEEYDAEVKKIEEAKAKAEAQKQAKAQALAAERAAIEKAYQERLKANPFDPNKRERYGSRKRGKYRVPYQDYIKAETYRRDAALASINIRESGISIKNITLSRTAAKVMQGKAVGGDRHVQYQVGVARANQEVRSGKISPTEYTQRMNALSQTYNEAQHQFTIDTARSAATNLRSTGNAQVYNAIDVELKRLGGAGLGGTGPTMISETLVKDSPSIVNRAPVAPGTAAKAQDFPDSFKSSAELRAPTKPTATFASIATPGTSMRYSNDQAVAPQSPVRKDETMRNMISPLLIPVRERSNIGYAPDGKPLQGPPQKKEQGNFIVGDKKFAYAAEALDYVEKKNAMDRPLTLQQYRNQFQFTYTVDGKEF